jgi:hypothetical protein
LIKVKLYISYAKKKVMALPIKQGFCSFFPRLPVASSQDGTGGLFIYSMFRALPKRRLKQLSQAIGSERLKHLSRAVRPLP